MPLFLIHWLDYSLCEWRNINLFTPWLQLHFVTSICTQTSSSRHLQKVTKPRKFDIYLQRVSAEDLEYATRPFHFSCFVSLFFILFFLLSPFLPFSPLSVVRATPLFRGCESAPHPFLVVSGRLPDSYPSSSCNEREFLHCVRRELLNCASL